MSPMGVYPRPSAEERYWAKVVRRGDDECWEWTGSHHPSGYTSFTRPWGYAHRFAYSLTYGQIPRGFQIDHLCQNKGCINPRHLEAVTPRENTHRWLHARGNTCSRGHDLGPVGGTRTCRPCHALREAQRRDRLKASGQWYTPERRARDTERARRWRDANPEKVREIHARFAAKHRGTAA